MVRPGLPRPGEPSSRAHTMKCSLRVWFLSMAFLAGVTMSLLFTCSHHSTATLPYLDSGALDGAGLPGEAGAGYAGLQRLSKEGPAGKTCASVAACMGDTGASEWFEQPLQQQHLLCLDSGEHGPAPDVQRCGW